jgi:dihydropteroate synthase
MGILNINDDSFSGDGRLDVDWALRRAVEMVGEGADIIDVGGESARTNRGPIDDAEEIARTKPFLERFGEVVSKASPRDSEQVFPPLVSLNTWRPAVVHGVLDAGFDILNDMGALPNDSNARFCAKIGAALLIMHSQGEPKIPHRHVTYSDLMSDLVEFFAEKTKLALSAGVSGQSIILDPGIDFAKQFDDNLQLIQKLNRISDLGYPVLLPVSRKSVIGRVLGLPNPIDRDAGTIACIVAGFLRGASIFRVHNVDAAWMAIRSMEMMK